jgi:hypothetical protein
MAIQRFVSGRLVRSLSMSVQVKNLLERENVVLVEELARCTRREILGVKGIGLTRLLEIRLALGERGLALADDPHAEYFIDEAKALPRHVRPGSWRSPFDEESEWNL